MENKKETENDFAMGIFVAQDEKGFFICKKTMDGIAYFYPNAQITWTPEKVHMDFDTVKLFYEKLLRPERYNVRKYLGEEIAGFLGTDVWVDFDGEEIYFAYPSITTAKTNNAWVTLGESRASKPPKSIFN